MAITEISRDWGVRPSLVRITTTDGLAAITANGYLNTQTENIESINHGEFVFKDGDLVAIFYDGGEGMFTHDESNATFVSAGGGGSSSVPYVPPTTTESAGFEFLEATNNGTDKATLKSPANIASDYEVTLPPDNSAGTNSFLTYSSANNVSRLSYPTGGESVLLDITDIPYFAVMLEGDATSQAMISHGSIMSPQAAQAGIPQTTGRFSFNEGTGGTGNVSGFSFSNDDLFCFPFYLMHNEYDQVRVNIQTGDAGGTAQLEVNVFNPYWDSTTAAFMGSSLITTVVQSNVATTGELVFNFSSPKEMSGWVWVVFRASNIGSILSLGTSANIYPERVQNILPNNDSTDAKLSLYGYIIPGQASMPITGVLLSPGGVIPEGVGVAIRGA